MDEFLIRALLAGIGVAIAAGPLGCFMVWRRMAYFGAALSHSALLGVALGLLVGSGPISGIILFCLLFAVLLYFLEGQRYLATDTLLGILAHGMLAAGLVVVAMMESVRIDLLGYLFGDVLAVDRGDLYFIYATVLFLLLLLSAIWRPLLAATVNPEMAAVEGVRVSTVRLVYSLMIALFIAIGMRVLGLLLIVSLLIIPAASARRLSSSPEGMALFAVLIGIISVVAGLTLSMHLDLPSGPAIVVVATLLFACIFAWPKAVFPKKKGFGSTG